MPLTILTEEHASVIIAVRRAHETVRMPAREAELGLCDTRLMEELDEDDGTVHPVVERALVVEWTDPGEVGLAEVRLDLLHLQSRVRLALTADEELQDLLES